MRPVYQQIAARAAADPDAPAVVAAGGSLTCGELNLRANRLAHALRARGVGPEVPVALLIPRDAAGLIAALAVAKAGGCYLPLDPAYPPERLRHAVADSGARVLVTTAPLLAAVPGLGETCRATLRLDSDQEEIAAGSAADPLPTAGLDHLAYVIYTSGSTGTPKGVEVAHRGLANLVAWHLRIYNLGPGDRTTRLAGAGFDAAVWEIWTCLAAGATLYLPPGDVLLAPDRLVAWLAEHRITQTFLPTPLAEAALAEPWPADAPLEVLLTGGDRLHRGPRPEQSFVLANHYGPTEATVCATWAIVEPERGGLPVPPPIGRPIDRTTVHRVDRDFRPAPEDAPGELLIGGPGLARGYRGRPDLTAERFVPDPSGGAGERLYRTGDLVQELPSGDLDFVGRIDSQVKIRGFRIELGEIEAVLRSHPGVRQGVVLAREEKNGERRLVGYVAPGSSAPGSTDLRAFLARALPEPMVPAAWVFLPALPLTPNGKVDRAALGRIAPAIQAADAADAALDPVAFRLAAIFGEVLGIDGVGAGDDFFALGGHSLKATQVLSRVRAAWGAPLSVQDLYAHPTAAALARRVADGAAGFGGSGAPAEAIRPRPRSGDLPLSYAQQEIWFMERWAPGTAVYNTPLVVDLAGLLDVSSRGALGRALATLVRRHESLRTLYPEVSGRPVQRVISLAVSVPLRVVDLAGLPAELAAAVVERLTSEEGRRPIDLERGPVVRALLFRRAPAEHRLLLLLHHIATDDWTFSLLLADLAALYMGSPLPEPAIQYADFALWQREHLSGAVLEAHLAYWRERLRAAPQVLELPADRPRPAELTFAGARWADTLPADLVDRLGRLARQTDASPFMVLLAGWSALLGRYAGQDDLLVGVPSANRNRVELEGLAGLLVNTLVLRAELAGSPSGETLLGRLRATTLGAYAHQDLPFDRLVDALQPARDPSRHPLVQVFFSFGDALRLPRRLGPGLDLSRREVDGGGAKVDLSLYAAAADGGGLALQWEYATALFEAATVERFAGHFRTLLAGLADRPESPVAELPLLSAAERRQLAAWNGAGAAGAAGSDIAGRAGERLDRQFAAQAARTPWATALIAGEERLTYDELAFRVDRLARRLAALGVAPEVPVALFLPRTADLVVAMLATLAAGGFYVPLDPAYPDERLAYLLADNGATLLLTVEALAARAPAGPALRPIRLDGPQASALPETPEPQEAPLAPFAGTPDNLAYLIYTSGSTGRPKAVAVTHRSAALLVRWAETVFAPAERAAVLAATSIAFDLSVFEIFVPLATGGAVVLAENLFALADLPARGEVTLVNTVPSALAELLRLAALPPTVRTVNLAGEALHRALADQVYARPGVRRLYNLYGPSEDTTYSTFARVERRSCRAPALGAPVEGTAAHVLGPGGEPTPVGAPGELFLGGAGLARGYLGRPELTAERFVPDPFAALPGSRLYRTGDLVRRRSDLDLEFLGRLDHQVKVRGFRIELGEVEAALAACPGVQEAVVTACREGRGAARLVAYIAYVASSAGAVGAVADLRRALAERLPSSMIPAAWVFLPALPRTPNGKVDRRALPAPEPERPAISTPHVAPRNVLERTLAEIWTEVLRLPGVGVLDNFFELGGDSILTIQVVARGRRRGLSLTSRQLFRHQTVAALAAAIADGVEVAAVAPSGEGATVADEASGAFPQAGLTPAELDELLAELL